MQDHKPTLSSVTDGLGKLIRDVRGLQAEVAKLTAAVRGFNDSHPHPGLLGALPDSAGGSDRAQFQTWEPRSEIKQIRYEYRENPNLEVPTRTILAIAKELDGALRDIRAARLDLKTIADDPDQSASFREWQQSQKDG